MPKQTKRTAADADITDDNQVAIADQEPAAEPTDQASVPPADEDVQTPRRQLFGRLNEARQRRTAKLNAAYDRLVLAVAHGEEVDPAAVVQLLDDSGRTVEDLDRDAAFVETRRAKIAELAALPEIEAELVEIKGASRTRTPPFRRPGDDTRKSANRWPNKSSASRRAWPL
jgi:hypothetical protein